MTRCQKGICALGGSLLRHFLFCKASGRKATWGHSLFCLSGRRQGLLSQFCIQGSWEARSATLPISSLTATPGPLGGGSLRLEERKEDFFCLSSLSLSFLLSRHFSPLLSRLAGTNIRSMPARRSSMAEGPFICLALPARAGPPAEMPYKGLRAHCPEGYRLAFSLLVHLLGLLWRLTPFCSRLTPTELWAGRKEMARATVLSASLWQALAREDSHSFLLTQEEGPRSSHSASPLEAPHLTGLLQ